MARAGPRARAHWTSCRPARPTEEPTSTVTRLECHFELDRCPNRRREPGPHGGAPQNLTLFRAIGPDQAPRSPQGGEGPWPGCGEPGPEALSASSHMVTTVAMTRARRGGRWGEDGRGRSQPAASVRPLVAGSGSHSRNKLLDVLELLTGCHRGQQRSGPPPAPAGTRAGAKGGSVRAGSAAGSAPQRPRTTSRGTGRGSPDARPASSPGGRSLSPAAPTPGSVSTPPTNRAGGVGPLLRCLEPDASPATAINGIAHPGASASETPLLRPAPGPASQSTSS